MRLVLPWAEGLHLKLSILGSQTCSVCIHPPNHSVLPLSDCCQLHRCERFREIFLKCPEGIVTILLEPFLHSTPKEFNEVQFTVEFGQKNAQMSCSFNNLLNQWLLFSEVRLEIQDVCYTASSWFDVTRVLARCMCQFVILNAFEVQLIECWK